MSCLVDAIIKSDFHAVQKINDYSGDPIQEAIDKILKEHGDQHLRAIHLTKLLNRATYCWCLKRPQRFTKTIDQLVDMTAIQINGSIENPIMADLYGYVTRISIWAGQDQIPEKTTRVVKKSLMSVLSVIQK